MDKILHTNREERYGPEVVRTLAGFGFKPAVRDFADTKLIMAKTDAERRYLVHLFFSFLVQMEMCEVASGIENLFLYDATYHELESWRSPAFRLRHAALWQYQILGSRVAMEIFMDLIHAIDTGKRLNSSKSTFSAFRKWLCNVDNPFVYFAHVLIAAFRFDRKHRTPEAHGSSRVPRRLLLLQVPESKELNEPLQLTNVLSSIWPPLKAILDGRKAQSISLIPGLQADLENWLKTYSRGSSKEFKEMFEAILSIFRGQDTDC
ncbi:MAG: hypothetical protein NTV79_00805 [Candidatus Aureabacteria bacterium]|nr:hypothetical protein [Candidatus Auribacterota bacterium]